MLSRDEIFGAGGTSTVPAVAVTASMTMADALPSAGDEDASAFDVVEKLMALAKLSENQALSLTEELTRSLAPINKVAVEDKKKNNLSKRSSGRSSNLRLTSSRDGPGGGRKASVKVADETKEDGDRAAHFPISLPSSLQPKKVSGASPQINSGSYGNNMDGDDNHGIFTVPMACAESIQHSLGKIAVTGGKASSELRSLENERQTVDQHASDLAAALTLRQLSQQMVQTFNQGKLRDCVHAIANYRSVNPTPRALALVGPQAIDTYTDMEVKLTMEMLRRYEISVRQSDVHALSELTPLLGMLSLAHKGVGLYLQYTKASLEKIVRDATFTHQQQSGHRERGHYPTAEQVDQPPPEAPKANVPMQLAKMYNGAVTHLRHHLPMVVSALGEADGDVALVRLVAQTIGEEHATRLLKQFCQAQRLTLTGTKSELVVNAIMDRYVGGGNGAAGMEYQEDVLTNPSVAIAVVTGGVLSDDYHRGGAGNDSHYDDPELQEDCGFHATLGTLGGLDTFLDDCALCLQHTESYERFVQHASEEVGRARDYRNQQKKLKEEAAINKAKEGDEETKDGGNNDKKKEDDKTKEEEPILPPTSQLDEICSELGGQYSGIEHCLLLAAMQRAFAKIFHTTRPFEVERLFQPVGILDSNSHSFLEDSGSVAGANALQTCLVEECFYAAQRSTLRAFATGHAGTACAAANFCSDAIGRALLQVVIRKTEMSVVALRPGEGLLVGQGGLSQMTMNALRNVNALTQRSKSAAGKKGLDTSMAEDAMEQLMQYRIRVGIARACASFNDVEVAMVRSQIC
jgi:hypothetical protein